jgi:hypothetical protein
MPAVQIPTHCPNCEAPRAGVQDGAVVFRCGSAIRESLKPGKDCRKVLMRIVIELKPRE